MKFEIGVTELKLALQKAKTTISQKDVQPVLRNFCLKLVGKELSIMATDLDLASVCKVEVEKSEMDGTITVPGAKLFDIISRASSDSVKVEVEGMKAQIVSGAFAASLSCLSAEDFPTIAEFAEDSATALDKDSFLKSLDRISFSISDNEARKNLLAVYINKGFIQASDGHVSSVCKFSSKIGKTLIPALAVPDLVRVLKASEAKEVEIAATDSFLMFRLEKDLFVTRLSQAVFPDILPILKSTESNPISISFDKKDLVSAVQRVSVTSNVNSFALEFEISETSAKISSSDPEGNTSEEIIQATASEKVSLSLNYEYVLDICKSVSSDTVNLLVNSNIRVPLRIEDGDFISLLMRLSSAKKNGNSTEDTRS